MDRRKFLIRSLAVGAGTLSLGQLGGDSRQRSSPLPECSPSSGKDVKTLMRMQSSDKLDSQANKNGRYTLRIAPVVIQLTRKCAISTIGYNGSSPGPLLRMREGVPVTVDVINDTDVPELVHWHGLVLPPEVDGSEDEGTPFIAPRSTRRYQFVPGPAGTRWYHTQVSAGIDLYRGLYTGQFGFVYVEPKNEPGRYDQEFFLALREWEPFYSPQKRRASNIRSGLQVGYRMFSINDKALGCGEPLRVKHGHRALFHVLNASATEHRAMALPGHRFQVIALDGNAVPRPRLVDILQLGPGERVDAVVDMNHPGVWIFGCTNDNDRNNGLGVVVEYAEKMGFPQWVPPPNFRWDYADFGRAGSHPAPDETIRLVFETVSDGVGEFDAKSGNGQQQLQEIALREGSRYRLILHNRSDSAKPIHLHRHSFEIVEIDGRPTSGIMKDTVVINPHGRVSVDVAADQTGLSLLHCNTEQYTNYGLKTLFRCT